MEWFDLRVSRDFVVRSVMDEYVIVPVGQSTADFNGIISTNATGVFLWELLQNDTTESALVEKLTEEYDVSRIDAENDVAEFLKELSEQGILETP